MSQIIANELAILLEEKKQSISYGESFLASQVQQLAANKKQIATVTKQLAEYAQALAGAQTDQQKAIFNKAIIDLTPTLVALNNKTSGLQAAVDKTRAVISTQQKAVDNIQQQITAEKNSDGQTGPVPTDTATNTTDTAVNTTAIEIPEPIPITDPELVSYVEPSNSSPSNLYPIFPGTIDEYSEPSLISPYNAPIIPLGAQAIDPSTDPELVSYVEPSNSSSALMYPVTSAPQAIDQNTEPSNSSPFIQSATGNVVSVSSILGAPGPAGFSTQGLLQQARSQAVVAAQVNQTIQEDWRVRLHLAQNANYLYLASKPGDLLFPLRQTKGVIFPYTPAISVAYTASYPAQEITHSNYKIYQYKGSSVDTVTITCDFTAQDNSEANYLLAVIHFFRSVTKMFYGQDQNPNPGVPPPLCYLSGLGEFQFNNHALVVSQFTYELPTEVDYIRAGAPTTIAGTPLNNLGDGHAGLSNASSVRRNTNGVPIGGEPFVPMFQQQSTYLSNSNVTYVPTKMKMSITCYPVVSRNQVSKDFSLRDYATGALVKGGFW